MADEITVAASLTVTDQNSTFALPRFGTTQLQADQANPGILHFTQNIGTSAETVDTSSMTNEGWCIMKNLDATNYITWGPDSTGQVTIGRILPGEQAGPFQLEPGITLKATADTAACDLEILVLEL